MLASFGVEGLLHQVFEAFKGFFVWFEGQSLTFQFQTFGALFAASSVASNFRAIGGVWNSMTKCERLLDFTGLRIGRSDDFQAPMRALLLSFALYAAYQILSHLTGLVVEASWSAYLLDVSVQTFLFALLMFQFLNIWRMASNRYESDDGQRMRFWRTFNDALKAKQISMRQVAVSTVILPVSAVSPKAVKLLAANDPNMVGIAERFGAFLPW